MTERETIISLAESNGCRMPLRAGYGDCRMPQFYSVDDLVKFYHASIADFLKSSGQYLTNDASREACIKQTRNEAYNQVIEFVRNKNYDNDPYILANKIEKMKEQS